MSTTANPSTGVVEPDGAHHHGHDHGHDAPFRAHHFESWTQQFDAGKLGMWVFLVQEILFFSGLFCAYAVYRTLHPEVFEYADQFLSLAHGTFNTVVLLFSSLTMAWAVRCAMLGQHRGLILCLGTTIFCAALFLGVKMYEYTEKIHAHLVWAGAVDQTVDVSPGGISLRPPTIVTLDSKTVPTTTAELEERFIRSLHSLEFGFGVAALLTALAGVGAYFALGRIGLATVFGSISLSAIAVVIGIAASIGIHNSLHAGEHGAEHGDAAHAEHHEAEEAAPHLTGPDRPLRLGSFFGIYYVMTGIHAIHIILGMVALTWLLVRAVKRHFHPEYFGPVDFVGLYWHLVDLIWIYLFPLLYLIG